MSKNDNKAVIVRAGAIEPLVAMLRGGSAGAQEQAAGALSRLADNTDNGVAIAQAGAIEPLVALLKSGSEGGQEAAAAALCHLVESLTDADMQVAIVRAGAIEPLVALVRGDRAKAQEAAAFVLASLALHNADNQAAIALAGAVEPLVTMMRLGSPPARRAAIVALLPLASMADTLVAFAQPGDLKPLIAWARGDTADAQDTAQTRKMTSGLLSILAANSVEIKRAIEREVGVGGQRRLIGGSAGALHSLGSNILLTVVAGALLAYGVYSRRAAQPRAKQVRRPEDRRRRRQAGAAAEATQDEAQVETNKARAEVEAGKHKAAKAEAAALAAAEKADAATKARATAAAGKAARAAAAEKVAEAAKAAAAEKATAKAVAKAAAEKAAAERAAAVEAANAVEELEKPPPLPVMSLASAQFDTGRRAVPESTIGGQTTCIVCFVNPKSHIAVPCGHQCACGDCAAKMNECPVCRNPAREWMQVRVA